MTTSAIPLRELIDPANLVQPISAVLADRAPTLVTGDSREVVPGALFVAIVGEEADGHAFLKSVVERGALAVVTERAPEALPVEIRHSIPIVQVHSARAALGKGVSRSLGEPSRDLPCIGVTGTNGKTSVSWIVSQALARLTSPTLLVGTLGSAIVSAEKQTPTFRDTGNTTPGSPLVHRLLRSAVSGGAGAAVFEATSLGLIQHRTAGVHWDVAVFTNLTRDHLDVHGSMDAYGAAKELLFTRELAASGKSVRTAVLNADDPFSARIERAVRSEPALRCVTYGTKIHGTGPEGGPDIRLESCKASLNGSELTCSVFGRSVSLRTRLIGAYNISNTLATLGVLIGLGYGPEAIASALSDIPAVPGRLEVIPVGSIRCVVDYAHTPDALIQVQRSLREVIDGRLITVFGCGGNRDRGKRPLMGEAVAALSDLAVVTSDNPRHEDPVTIIADILPGLDRETERGEEPGMSQKGAGFRYVVEPDRRAAIRRACELAVSGDTVLIAGKGHEDYQDIAGTKYPFTDQGECRIIAQNWREPGA